MRRRLFGILTVCVLLLCVSLTVSAKVLTAEMPGGEGILVAGNTDFYPIEYYDRQSGQFEGVMPEILRVISDRTGIDFTYIRSEELTQTELAQNRQAAVVSAFVTDSSESFVSDSVTVFSYNDNGKKVNIGFAFTDAVDEELVSTLKAEVAKITEEEINGYFMSSTPPADGDGYGAAVISVVLSVVLVFAVIFLCLRLKKTANQMNSERMTDGETGLGNLAYFEKQFEDRITDSTRTSYSVAHIMIDRNFLQIYHGETVFANAVKYAASVLSAYSSSDSFAARMTESGFAFAFLRTGISDPKEYMESLLLRLNLPDGEERSNRRTVFHGAVYDLEENDYNCELILFNLRRNCNRIIGTDTQIIFCDSGAMNSVLEEKKLTESFSGGFKNKEFKLYLQFTVDTRTKKIVSAEALSRWDCPGRGILSPAKYIESMENVGMISELDFYMFEMVCRQLHKWRDTEFDTLSVSCNFTRITLSEEDFADRVREISSRYVFDKSKLVMEITEDAIEKDITNALDNVVACKEMGFKIALDDLGSGYTSLLNLCDYPVDIVKIDRDILLKTDRDSGKELFEGIVALAHSLNKTVVCEGVETEEQNCFVTASDCDYIQGWYYSKPLPVKESEEYYRSYTGGC